MTPAEEARFIELWQQGASYAAIAQALGIPAGTVSSRAAALQRQGKIQPRPRGGAYPHQQAQGRSGGEGGPSTVHPATEYRPPSTVDPQPSTGHPPQAALTAALTAALQPILARLAALETGLARPSPEDRPPSTVHPDTVDGPPAHRPPSTVDPKTWELKQLKHSVRWTVYVPQAMKEELQRRAAARGQNPSLLVQEALARWLAEVA
jgi:Homeodomain-like domain/Ribbon-helix-helix protein, copG family